MAWIAILIVFLLVMAAVILWPILSARRANPAMTETPLIQALKSDLNVQLARLEGVREDEKNARLSANQREGVEAEIGRAIIQLQRQIDEAEGKSSASEVPFSAFKQAKLPLSIIAISGIASLLVYSFIGSPSLQARGLNATELAQRQQLALASQTPATSANDDASINAQLNEAEFLDLVQNAQENPQNVGVQRALVRALMQRQAFDGAIPILRHIIDIDGRSPDNLSALAEAQLNASRGQQIREPLALLNEALQTDPNHIQSRFYLAAIATQQQNWPDAAQKWLELIALGEGGEGWLPIAARSLQEVEAQIFERADAGPNAGDVNNAASMSADDRAAFIASMVAGLETRLSDEGGGVTEWLRLIRSYRVLGNQEASDAAIAKAREQLNSPTALKAFNILLAMGN